MRRTGRGFQCFLAIEDGYRKTAEEGGLKKKGGSEGPFRWGNRFLRNGIIGRLECNPTLRQDQTGEEGQKGEKREKDAYRGEKSQPDFLGQDSTFEGHREIDSGAKRGRERGTWPRTAKKKGTARKVR